MNINATHNGFSINNAKGINKNSTPAFKGTVITKLDIPIEDGFESVSVINVIREKATGLLKLNKLIPGAGNSPIEGATALADLGLRNKEMTELLPVAAIDKVVTDSIGKVGQATSQTENAIKNVAKQSEEAIKNVAKQSEDAIKNITQAAEALSQKAQETAAQKTGFFQKIQSAVSQLSTGGKVGLAIGAAAVVACGVYGIYSACKNIALKKAGVKNEAPKAVVGSEIQAKSKTIYNSTTAMTTQKPGIFSQFA